MTKTIVHPLHVEDVIIELRGDRVILDEHLAALYGVTTKRLNEQLKRNRSRFPDDFIFKLSAQEWSALRSQFATLKPGRGQHRKYLPHAFTEHGAIMAANILNSQTAIDASVKVVRAFILLRKLVVPHHQLARKVAQHDKKLVDHDDKFKQVFDTFRELMETPPRPRKRIGFRDDKP